MAVLTQTITIGHTPDLDDAFMFYALAHGKVTLNGFAIQHVIEDIQSLNHRALRAELDITAVSAASFPDVAKDYWILSVGSSVGQDYGPLVVSMSGCNPEQLNGRRIAVPGNRTTAYMVLKLAIPHCVPVEMRFEDVPAAVLERRVGAGLLIHEWQLTYRDRGLLPILDLGTWWQKQKGLPLPLGLNVIKQSLGKATAVELARGLRESILYAMTHQDEAITGSMQYGRGIDLNRARQFVGMYVNEETLSLSAHSRQALRELYEMAQRAGLLTTIPPLVFIDPPKL